MGFFKSWFERREASEENKDHHKKDRPSKKHHADNYGCRGIRLSSGSRMDHLSQTGRAGQAKSEVAKVRHSLDLTQEAFADLLGIGLSTLRSWEQKKREPSGAARMLISIALKHPEVLQEAVA